MRSTPILAVVFSVLAAACGGPAKAPPPAAPEAPPQEENLIEFCARSARFLETHLK